VRTGKRLVVRLMVATPQGSEWPQALSLRIIFADGEVRNAVIHRAGAARAMQPVFEITRRSAGALSYLVSFDGRIAGTVAEVELDAPAGARVAVEIDPNVTLLSNAAGTRKATVAAGTLQVSGTASEPARPERKE